jgi:N-acetylneuraminic acid mutarotase
LLSNGNLIAVGVDNRHVYELNLETEIWSFRTELLVRRQSPTFTELDDGRILIVGGGQGATYFGSAEVYDPEFNTVQQVADIKYARTAHCATRLLDGRVLVTGGFDSTEYSEVEIYDPRLNLWTEAEAMNFSRYFHECATLKDGKVMAFGGLRSNNTIYPENTEIYDPNDNTWKGGPSILEGAMRAAVTPMPNDMYLMTGGTNDKGSISRSQLYNVESNSWLDGQNLNEARRNHSSTLLRDGLVLVVGGETSGQQKLAGNETCELFDPSSRTWHFTTSLAAGNANPPTLALTDGRVVVVGGSEPESQTTGGVTVVQARPTDTVWFYERGL